MHRFPLLIHALEDYYESLWTVSVMTEFNPAQGTHISQRRTLNSVRLFPITGNFALARSAKEFPSLFPLLPFPCFSASRGFSWTWTMSLYPASFDDNDPAIVYSGSGWELVTEDGQWRGTMHSTSVTGSWARVRFTGAQIPPLGGHCLYIYRLANRCYLHHSNGRWQP